MMNFMILPYKTENKIMHIKLLYIHVYKTFMGLLPII